MTLRLSNGRMFTQSEALEDETNLLCHLRRAWKTLQMFDLLWSKRAILETLCAHHLGLAREQCVVQDQSTWKRGQFNICVPLHVTETDGTSHRKMFRCPMPHKVAEARYPGTMDEKIRSEVANYVFVEAYCPEIPIARLVGFGLSNDHQYTHEMSLPWLPRMFSKARRALLSFLRPRTQSAYVRTTPNVAFGVPYILLDFIESDRGELLAQTWAQHANDRRRRRNLYRGLSQIFTSLSRIPQPRIGSLRFLDDGSIALQNPPLLCANTILESEGCPRAMNKTYSCSGSFLRSLLEFRRNALLTQPNATFDEPDCRLQMSHLILLAALLPQVANMTDKGLFVLQYTDLHVGNLFVDEQWNISGVIDLEYICALPIDMLSVPYWFTVEHIDHLSDHCEEHSRIQEEFLQILESEEEQQGQLQLSSAPLPSSAVRKAWESGAYWIYECFTSVDALPSIVRYPLWRRFGFQPESTEYENFANYLSHFWSEDANSFVEQKLREKAKYDEDLKKHFTRTLSMIAASGE